MQTRTTVLPVARSIAYVLGVCACFTSIAVQAAPKEKFASPLARQGMQLKLDVAMLNPALAAAAEEDCEGDLLVQPMITSPVQLASLASNDSSRSGRLNTAAVINDVVAATTTPATGKTAAEAPPSPVVVQAVAPVEAPKIRQTWEIVPADKTLNAALARWAASAGWQLVWELPVDYAVDARTTVPGTFEEAVGVVTKSMGSAEIPLKAIFYAGNKVLRIVAKGAE
ncbi:toxin co-regulated pilus biosynthesis Q family protein [Herbaspirillum sp. GCM10030257]|uniref:toxin co-regulated pilus biosynthesis Q family protein n=1 Tax=Herbaspirillum sp. GCM10030257 TaxID=3273393 RepID=UPI00360C7055